MDVALRWHEADVSQVVPPVAPVCIFESKRPVLSSAARQPVIRSTHEVDWHDVSLVQCGITRNPVCFPMRCGRISAEPFWLTESTVHCPELLRH